MESDSEIHLEFYKDLKNFSVSTHDYLYEKPFYYKITYNNSEHKAKQKLLNYARKFLKQNDFNANTSLDNIREAISLEYVSILLLKHIFPECKVLFTNNEENKCNKTDLILKINNIYRIDVKQIATLLYKYEISSYVKNYVHFTGKQSYQEIMRRFQGHCGNNYYIDRIIMALKWTECNEIPYIIFPGFINSNKINLTEGFNVKTNICKQNVFFEKTSNFTTDFANAEEEFKCLNRKKYKKFL